MISNDDYFRNILFEILVICLFQIYLLWAGSGFIEQTQSSGNTFPILFDENGRIRHLRHKSYKQKKDHNNQIFVLNKITQKALISVIDGFTDSVQNQASFCIVFIRTYFAFRFTLTFCEIP